MKTEELLKEIEGIKTLKMMQDQLGIDRARAIYLIHRLRKQGYIKTKYSSDKTRVYNISRMNKLGGISYIDIINKYAPLGDKLATTEINLIHGRIPSIEETLIYAIKKGSVRFVIASLALFRQIRNWSELYQLAKKQNVVREVAALYEVARLIIPKVRRIPKRFRNLAKPRQNDKYKYIVSMIRSDSFKEIEKKWKVYIPLNWVDLEEYK